MEAPSGSGDGRSAANHILTLGKERNPYESSNPQPHGHFPGTDPGGGRVPPGHQHHHSLQRRRIPGSCHRRHRTAGRLRRLSGGRGRVRHQHVPPVPGRAAAGVLSGKKRPDGGHRQCRHPPLRHPGHRGGRVHRVLAFDLLRDQRLRHHLHRLSHCLRLL